jgi:hypothetical protein
MGLGSKINTWMIGDPSAGGFRGVKLGGSNNELEPGESSNMYNYFANDLGLTKRKGYTLDSFAELMVGVGVTGLFRYYDGANYHTFAKCGTEVFDVKPSSITTVLPASSIKGDTNNQLLEITLTGANVDNTNGGLLYWKIYKNSIWYPFWSLWEYQNLLNLGEDVTVEFYKSSSGVDTDLVCSGSGLTGETINLAAKNNSGLIGTVKITYVADDIDLGSNILDFSLTVSNNLHITPLVSGGDVNKQLDDWLLNGVTDANASTGTLWWDLIDSSGIRTVNIYGDSAGTSLLATGSVSGEGTISLVEANDSGITGSVLLTTNIYTLLTEIRTQYIAHCGTGNATYENAKILLNELISDYKAHCAEGEETITDIYNLLTELMIDYPAHCARGSGTSHIVADTTNNSPITLVSNSLADMIATANSIKTKFNAHDGEYGTYHKDAGTSHQVTSIAAYNLNSLITLVNDIRTMYEAHRIDDGCHATIDVENVVGTNVIAIGNVHVTLDETNDDPTEIAADTLAAMIISANSFKTNFNAHDLNSTLWHKAAGTSHQINTTDATDMETLIVLLNAARIAYEAHRQDTSIHLSSDADNIVSTASITIGLVHSTIDDDNEDPTAITDTYVSSLAANANSLKTKFNAHDADGILYHTGGTGSIHQVTAANATNTATLIVLVNALRVAYEAHIADTDIHIDADSANIIDKDTLDASDVEDASVSSNTLTFMQLGSDDEIGFASWFSRYFFSDGSGLYSGTTGSALELKLYNENGYSLTADNHNEIIGIQPHGDILLVHKERLWLTRDPNYPTRVYWSQVNYYNRYFTNGDADVVCWVPCGQNDGQDITGMVRYQDKLFVTKLNQSYWIDGEPADTGSGTLNVAAGPTVGAYDQKTIVVCPDGYIRFFGPDGVWQYSDMLGTATTGAQHISKSIDSELDQISSNNKNKCCAIYYDHYYLLFYPYGDVNYCNRGMAYDTQRQQWYPIHDLDIGIMVKFEDDTLHAGLSNSGYVTQLFNGYNDNGNEIAAYFKSRFEGNNGIEQCLDSIRAVDVLSQGTFIISWGANKSHPAAGSFSTIYSGLGARLGEFILDKDVLVSLEDVESDVSEPFKRVRNTQRFQKIYFEISESSLGKHTIDYLEIRSYPIREI